MAIYIFSGIKKEYFEKYSLVGMTGFEPATSPSRTERATELRYIPTYLNSILHYKKNSNYYFKEDI